jgi:Fuc2NAc and GlcNAc transferase
MTLIVVMVALSAIVSLGVAELVYHRAEALRLVQAPNHRSSHVHPTPNGGGLGIVVAGSLAGVCLVTFSGWKLGYLMLGLSALLAGVGLFDDIQHLPARVRFGVQLLVSGGLLFWLGDLPRLTFTAGLELELGGWILSGLLLFACVWWINLFNFMDGIDGIAGMQAVFILLGGAVLSACGKEDVMSSPVWVLMLCVVAATVGFLLLNWPPAKIFMGDVGSTWLAFMVFALALLSVHAGWLSYATWLVLAAIFVTDATITLITRLLCGERWYEAHCNHAYQKLARRWGGHRPVTLRALAINMIWLAPLAGACTAWPHLAFGWLSLAYAPLVVGAIVLGAGRQEHT